MSIQQLPLFDMTPYEQDPPLVALPNTHRLRMRYMSERDLGARDVHAAWLAAMKLQGRHVEPDRANFDRLDESNQAIDEMIACDLVREVDTNHVGVEPMLLWHLRNSERDANEWLTGLRRFAAINGEDEGYVLAANFAYRQGAKVVYDAWEHGMIVMAVHISKHLKSWSRLQPRDRSLFAFVATRAVLSYQAFIAKELGQLLT